MLFFSTQQIHCNISSLSDNLDNFKTQRLNSIHYNAVDFRKDSTQPYQQVTNAFGKMEDHQAFQCQFWRTQEEHDDERTAQMCWFIYSAT